MTQSPNCFSWIMTLTPESIFPLCDISSSSHPSHVYLRCGIYNWIHLKPLCERRTFSRCSAVSSHLVSFGWVWAAAHPSWLSASGMASVSERLHSPGQLDLPCRRLIFRELWVQRCSFGWAQRQSRHQSQGETSCSWSSLPVPLPHCSGPASSSLSITLWQFRLNVNVSMHMYGSVFSFIFELKTFNAWLQ